MENIYYINYREFDAFYLKNTPKFSVRNPLRV